MAHFAELDSNNRVLQVLKLSNDDILDSDGNESESVGQTFCQNLTGSTNTWIQTSYNTWEGKHWENYEEDIESTDQSKALRKNYASVVMLYDGTGFKYDSPYPSWVFNNTTYHWEAPISMPDDNDTVHYHWDEDAYQADNTQGWSLGDPNDA